MDEREADRLIADLLAMTLRVDTLLKSDRPLTPLERDCLSNAIGSFNAFFAIRKTHDLPPAEPLR